jgi:citrate lyase subunit beta/citryl-CoA lyase
MLIATMMFVPAHDARKVAKALASSADAVILDLEDAVPEEMKSVAREAAAATVRDHTAAIPHLYIRVNALDSPHCQLDLEAIDWQRAGLLVPKAEDRDAIRRLARLTLSDLMLLIESAAGFAHLDELAGAGRPDEAAPRHRDLGSASRLRASRR